MCCLKSDCCLDPDVDGTPFVIVFDSREGRPYRFQNISSLRSYGGHPLRVEARMGHLHTGDYSLLGFQNEIGIERKSKEDLFSTLGRGRDRFYREFERLSEMRFAAVVVECSFSDIVEQPPVHSRVPPSAVANTVISWQMKFPVHWMFAGTRRYGEITTFRMIERFYHGIMRDAKIV